jgi:hypothetical protein
VNTVDQCRACGKEKNLETKEIYPYEGDGLISDEPITPLLEVDVQPTLRTDVFRTADICHECYHKLDVDMWISQAQWEELSPATEFKDLRYTFTKEGPVYSR